MRENDFPEQGSRARPAILLMAHGSKDPAGQRELLTLECAVRAAAARRAMALGVLEYPSDKVASIAAAAASLASSGAATVVAVPVLLLQAGHGKLDMPEQLALARARHPHIAWRTAPPLLAHPLLREIVQERFLGAGIGGQRCSGAATATNGGTQNESDSTTAVLLVGRGSHDPGANADFFKIARLFSEEYGHPLVEPCFVSLAAPDLAEGIRRCVALGARAVAIIPYFLHTGILVQRIGAQVVEAQQRYPEVALCVTEHLGNHPNLVRLLLLRAREAEYGVRPEPCLADGTLPAGRLAMASLTARSHQAP